jgi:hypothetical protein
MACSVNCLWCLKCFGVDNSQHGSRNLIVKSDGKTANFLLLFGVWVYANVFATHVASGCFWSSHLLRCWGNVVGPGEPKLSQDFLISVSPESEFEQKRAPSSLARATVLICKSRVRPEPLVLVDIVLTFFQSPNKSGNTFGNPSKPVLELGRLCGRMWQADVSSLFEYVW